MEIEQRIILDTDYLSYFLLQEKSAILKMEELLNQNYYPVTTAISKAEMFFGAYNKKWGDKKFKVLNDLFQSMIILDFTSHSATMYGKLRAKLILQGQDIGFADTAIASIALFSNCSVLTQNFSHFNRFENLNVIEFIR